MNEWISIKDKYPTDKKILITDGVDIYVSTEWYIDKDSLKIDFSYSDCCGCHATGITHWMELPELPKNE